LLLNRVEAEGQLAAVEKALQEGRNRETILALLVEYIQKVEAAEAGQEKYTAVRDQLLPLLLEESRLAALRGPQDAELVAVRERIQVARRLLVLPPVAWIVDKPSSATGASAGGTDAIDLHVQVLKQKLDRIKNSEKVLTEVFHTEEEQARSLASY